MRRVPKAPRNPPRDGRAKLFLWHGGALYVGVVPVPSAPHRHHAAQAGVSLGAPFGVRSGGDEPYEAWAGFVAVPGAAHQIDARGATGVFVWADPEHLAAGAFPEGGAPLPPVGGEQLRVLLPGLRSAGARPLDCAGAEGLFWSVVRASFATGGAPGPRPDPPDGRIREAIARMHEGDLLRAERPIARLAARVYLSEGRFRHLFREQTGMSVGRYLLWERLLAAIDGAAKGAPLSEAAHAAGFADSAHLSREFRAAFGLAPSEVFKNSRLVQVVPCPAR